MLGVLVMLSNFLHDLAVALFACGALGLAVLWRSALGADPSARPVVDTLDRLGRRVLGWSLLAIAVLGAVRGLAYERFEYNPAVGRAQVPALMIKHLLLAGLLVGALVVAAFARRRARAQGDRP